MVKVIEPATALGSVRGDVGRGRPRPVILGQASHVAGRPAFYRVGAEISPDPSRR